MAIWFYKKKKKQLYILVGLLILLLVMVFVLFKVLGRSSEGPSGIVTEILGSREKQIEISFDKLESQLLKDLQPFKPVSPPPDDLGRENPFSPGSPSGE